MDQKTRKQLDNLRSEDRVLQNQAFFYILKETEKSVDWAYDAWAGLVEGLRHKDNHDGRSRHRSLPTWRRVIQRTG